MKSFEFSINFTDPIHIIFNINALLILRVKCIQLSENLPLQFRYQFNQPIHHSFFIFALIYPLISQLMPWRAQPHRVLSLQVVLSMDL